MIDVHKPCPHCRSHLSLFYPQVRCPQCKCRWNVLDGAQTKTGAHCPLFSAKKAKVRR